MPAATPLADGNNEITAKPQVLDEARCSAAFASPALSISNVSHYNPTSEMPGLFSDIHVACEE